MESANIYITGQIGTSYNPDNSVKQKGVELQDVISQVEKNKEAKVKKFIITSEGGSVQVGKAIAAYVSSIKDAITIADQFCASIATEIHLSVPIDNRLIVAGTEYFIHAPLMVNVNGNADELNLMADYVKEAEKEMLSMYVKATGMDKAAIEGLMKQETSLTDVQAVELHFASKIIPSIEGNAAHVNKNIIAFFDKKQNTNNENTNQMKSFATELTEKFEAFKKIVAEKLGILEAIWKEEKTKDGKVFKVEMAGDQFAIGDTVTDESGAPTPNASYELSNGSVIKTNAESKISEISTPKPNASSEEVSALKAELEKAKKENEELKNVSLSIQAKMDVLAKSITSVGKPNTEASAQFRKRNVATDKEASLADLAAKKQKEAKDKNDEIRKKIGI